MAVIHVCRICKSRDLVPYLDLGHHPHSDRFLREEQLDEPEAYYPLKVVLCRECGMSQLSYTVDPKVLYQEEYLYESPQAGSGLTHYHRFAEETARRFNLKKGDLVVDIGSNIGTLLSGFKKMNLRVLGVDPARNIAKIATRRGVPTIADFWSPALADKIKKKYGQSKVITGTNVFAHANDHAGFLRGVKKLLAPRGVFIFESPHFMHLMDNLEYDTIYAQHLLYLSLRPVMKLINGSGLEVFRVEEYPDLHGGSFRVFLARKGERKVEPNVARLLAKEKRAGIHSLPALKIFTKKVEMHRRAMLDLLDGLRAKGKRIAIVSTPAKGMTLLNYCKIGTERIDFATERPNGLKCGRYTPGGHIPIVPDTELMKRRPDYALLLAWNFADDIMKNLSGYKKKGGKFIVPIPWPKII